MFSIKEELEKLTIDRSTLRNFGLLFCAVFWLIAAVVWKKSGMLNPWLAGAGALCAAVGLCRPMILRVPFLAWMSLAVVLNFFVLRIIFTVFFFLVITPLALVLRLLGKRPIKDGFDAKAETYWIAVDPVTDKDRYTHQF